jgi:hypothetical protein
VLVLNGTSRCLRPLPMTRTIRPDRFTSSMSRPHELAEAKAGCVEQLEDGAVAPSEGQRRIRHLEQPGHLSDGQMGGNRLRGSSATRRASPDRPR